MTAEDRRRALLDRLASLPPDRREALRRSMTEAAGTGAATADGPRWPLSFGQERLWFLSRFHPEDASYNILWPILLRGPVDAAGLAAALTGIAARHEVLRTRFGDGERPAQIVMPPAAVPVEEFDLTGDPGETVQKVVADYANRPFDLAAGPPWQAALMWLRAREEAILCVRLHHIAGDGWSLNVLMRELAEFYSAHREGRAPDLPDLPVQYRHYAVWERRRVAEEGAAHLDYWKRRLAGVPTLDLPTDRRRPRRWSGEGRREPVTVADDRTGALERLAKEHRCTLFMALVAVFQATLGAAAGQVDFAVGVPVVRRTRSEFSKLIGHFSNTMMVRADLSGDPTFAELLRRTRIAAFGALQHADAPFEQILAALRPPRDLSRPPLFQVMFNLTHNLPKGDLLRTDLADLAVEPYPQPDAGWAKAEVSIEVHRGPAGLGGFLEYNSNLFTAARARRLVHGFQNLIAAAAADPGARLSRLTSNALKRVDRW